MPGGVEPGTHREIPSGPDDAILLERCRGGDLPAFGLLVTRYQDRIHNAVLRLCGNPHDAEELSQETFVKALENLDGFRQASGFYTWLFRIAVNLAISRQRRAGRIRFHSLDAPTGGDASLAELIPDRRQEGPSDLADKADLNARVLTALNELDADFRVVVVLRDVEGMDYQQIAQVLDLPLGTVKSRLFRGRNLLQEALKDLLD